MTDLAKTDPVQNALVPMSERNLPMLSERFQPRNLTELMSWAKLVTSSGLAPKGMNEAGVVLCVQMGAELRISPAQAIQNVAVINGRPSIFGDLGLAIFKRDADYKSFEEDAPDVALKQGFGRCKIVMRNGEIVERRFSIEEAKSARLWGKEGPWTNYPGRMLMFRSRWWALRDAAPGVFKGCCPAEEIQDADLVSVTTVERPRSIEQGNGYEQVESFVKDVAGKAAPTQPGRPAAASATTPAPNQIAVGVLRSVDVKQGETKGKKWTRYTLLMADDTRYTTFSGTVGEAAQALVGSLPVEVTWEQKGEYRNAAAIAPHVVAEAPKTPPVEEQGDAYEPPEEGANLFGGAK